LKTVGRESDLWVRVPRLPPRRAHGPTGRHKLRKLEIWVRFPVSPLAVPWSNGNDSCPTNRKRWFNSIRDYLCYAQVRQLAERLGLNPRDSRFDSSSGHIRLGRQLADHFGLEPGMLWVRIPPELLATKLRPRGAAWSARLPVTQEIVGSNPIGDARQHGTQTGKATKLKPS
jgi:hypothetical protein